MSLLKKAWLSAKGPPHTFMSETEITPPTVAEQAVEPAATAAPEAAAVPDVASTVAPALPPVDHCPAPILRLSGVADELSYQCMGADRSGRFKKVR